LNVDRRLRKLGRRLASADRRSTFSLLVIVHDGDSDPVCPRCGRPLELVIKKVVITTREDVVRLSR
jgi:hypothetical protein